MLTHDHFLKQIQATPDDPLPRQIYADWLEEQGDRRAELIRLEIERGQLEPWSDRYATVQARLRELRPQIDAAWLTAMDYHWQHYPLFSVLPDEREHRWRLIERFFENWGHPIQPEDNYTREEIDAAERRLGVTVPAALREWYTRCGAASRIYNRHNYLRSPSMWFLDEQNSLSIAVENQGNEHWGIVLYDLTQTDPPLRNLLEPKIACESVSQFAIFWMLESVEFIDGTLTHFHKLFEDELLIALRKQFFRVEIPISFQGFELEFYEGPNLVLGVNTSAYELLVTARTPQAFQQLPNSLAGETKWMN